MNKLKLKEVKWDGNASNPQYQLQYANSGNLLKTRAISQSIRSRLFGDFPLLIEVDSSLFTADLGPGLALAKTFQKFLGEQQIEFRHRNEIGPASVNFLSLVTRKSTEQHWIATVVSARQWQNTDFQATLPTSGIRFYGFKDGGIPPNLLDELFAAKLSAAELLKLSTIMLFDVADYGQMGISSLKLSQAEIQALLDQVP